MKTTSKKQNTTKNMTIQKTTKKPKSTIQTTTKKKQNYKDNEKNYNYEKAYSYNQITMNKNRFSNEINETAEGSRGS